MPSLLPPGASTKLPALDFAEMWTPEKPARSAVLILKPRLDCTFKKGDVPVVRGPIPPIRLYWQRFLEMVEDEHRRRGDAILTIERPLWQFSPEMVEDLVKTWFSDALRVVVYVPHKRRQEFPLSVPARYYAQTVFPHCFTVDPHGWGPSMSVHPIEAAMGDPTSTRFDTLVERLYRNESKFPQPPGNRFQRSGHIAFLCQIPHDEAIRFHSSVSVEQALEATLEWARTVDKQVIVKGHPINPGSMIPLKQIAARYPLVEWVDNVSVHDVIRGSQAVFCVNSGAGIEAILHQKPVVIFGSAEYETIVNVTTPDTIARTWQNLRRDVEEYRQWIDAYFQYLVDTTDPFSFAKVN